MTRCVTTLHPSSICMRLGILSVILSLACLVGAHDALANVYAGQLKITDPDGSEFDGSFDDGSGALLTFYLNDDASSVTIEVKEATSGDVVHTIDAGAMERGFNSVEWDGTGTESGTSYVFEVTAEQPNASTEEWTVFFDSGPNDIWTRGGEVVRRMDSPWFGMMFTTNTGGPLGKGLAIYNADASQSDPFLVASDEDWGEGGSDSVFSGILDEEDRYYVSVVQSGEVRRIDPNDDFSVTTIITGLEHTKMLFLVGEGAERVLYITDDNRVVRAAIGDEDVFTGDVEVLAEFDDRFPRALAVDDEGFLYVSFRETNAFFSDPLGLEKYDISGDLPVGDGDAVWSIGEDLTHQVAELIIDRGADSTSADDDILYYSTRAGSGSPDDGVWRVDDIQAEFAAEVLQVVGEDAIWGGDNNIQTRAAISLDPAGNIILLENANEHTFFLSPPGEGETNSFTTTSLAFDVGDPVSRGKDELPEGYELSQNYPNPFNPVTTISYTLGRDDFTTVKVYNALGAEVRTLVEEFQASGSYEVTWDGRDAGGRSLSSGVYLLRLSSGAFDRSIRMSLVK